MLTPRATEGGARHFRRCNGNGFREQESPPVPRRATRETTSCHERQVSIPSRAPNGRTSPATGEAPQSVAQPVETNRRKRSPNGAAQLSHQSLSNPETNSPQHSVTPPSGSNNTRILMARLQESMLPIGIGFLVASLLGSRTEMGRHPFVVAEPMHCTSATGPVGKCPRSSESSGCAQGMVCILLDDRLSDLLRVGEEICGKGEYPLNNRVNN